VAVDSWSLVSRGSQPHSRNQQKSHALHSHSVGNYIPVPTYFSGSSAFQCNVPCQHIHSFRVPIVTIPDSFTLANFKTLGMKYQGIKNNALWPIRTLLQQPEKQAQYTDLDTRYSFQPVVVHCEA